MLEILLVAVSSDFFVLGHNFFAGQMFCWRFLLVFLMSPLKSFLHLQSDDLKLHHEQSKYWTIFMLSEEIVVKNGWRNSRILRTNSLGLGKITASLTYFSVQQERKKVRLYSTLFLKFHFLLCYFCVVL